MIKINSSEIIDRGSREFEKKIFTPGRVIAHSKKENYLFLELEEGEIALKFLTADIVRVVLSRDENFDLDSTHAVIDHNLTFDQFTVIDSKEKIKVRTAKIELVIDKGVFSLSFYDRAGNLFHKDASPGLGWTKDEVCAWKKTNESEKFYGLGEKTGFLDKKGKKYTMWNTDVYEAHVETTDPMYVSIPFFIGFEKGKSYGIYFDNSYKSHFDFRVGDDDQYSFWAEGGKIDYYLIYGPGIKDLLKRYTDLTGKMPLPPKWSLGYHQSRYSYKAENEVREITQKFRKKSIPCDVIHLDIHYMDGYRVFTWDKERFPQPARLISDLEDKGFKVVNIIDPGVKKDPQYQVYRDGIENNYFCHYLDGRLYSGDVWPGESVFPDFTEKEVRDWWGKLHKNLLEIGVKGIWNDMNEPAIFNKNRTMDTEVIHKNDGDPDLHKRFHNLYALFEAEATYNGIKKNTGERPFVLTRAGFAGIQRYAACWTGDNRSFWDHLKLAVPMLLNMGLSGISFAGTDIGGFTADSSGELLARWTQLGTFMPFFRNHSSVGTIFQEPWAFGEKYEKVIKKFIRLRYKFMPYIYNLFYESSQSGLPIIRPLFMEYPDDENTYDLSYQFMVGEDILVAPIYEKGKRKKLVYLPQANWINYFTGEKYNGGQYIIEDSPLEKMPLYIRGGAIILLTEAMNYIGEKEVDTGQIVIFLDDEIEENSYQIYEDDGISFSYKKGDYNLTEISYRRKDKKIEFAIKKIHENYRPEYDNFELIFQNCSFRPKKILFKEKEIKNWKYNSQDDCLKVKIAAGSGRGMIKN